MTAPAPNAPLLAKAFTLFVNRHGTRCLKRVAAGERVTSMAVSYVMLRDKGLIEKEHFVTTSKFKGWRLTKLGVAYCELNHIAVVESRYPRRAATQHEYEPHPAPIAAPAVEPTAEETRWEQQRLAKEAQWIATASAATPLERRVATVLCQFNRITRDMPSDVEIGRALPQVRSLITEVLGSVA